MVRKFKRGDDAIVVKTGKLVKIDYFSGWAKDTGNCYVAITSTGKKTFLEKRLKKVPKKSGGKTMRKFNKGDAVTIIKSDTPAKVCSYYFNSRGYFYRVKSKGVFITRTFREDELEKPEKSKKKARNGAKRKFDVGDSVVIAKTEIKPEMYGKIDSFVASTHDMYYRVELDAGFIQVFRERELRNSNKKAENQEKKPEKMTVREGNLFLCSGCSDKCTLRVRISSGIANADLSICPQGFIPKFVLIEKKDLAPLIRRLPVSVCTLCNPHKYFIDPQAFLVHIIEHAPDDGQVPFTRVVFGRIPKKSRDNTPRSHGF